MMMTTLVPRSSSAPSMRRRSAGHSTGVQVGSPAAPVPAPGAIQRGGQEHGPLVFIDLQQFDAGPRRRSSSTPPSHDRSICRTDRTGHPCQPCISVRGAHPPLPCPHRRAILTRMRRQPHWTALIAWLVLPWCAAVAVNHFWVPGTWAQSLRTGVLEIPVWVGIGFISHQRAKRRRALTAQSGSPAADPATPTPQ